ncbi:hypothetical protein BABINDRAFT_162103 [Babjeviella inositovora NRRL Y-12698]|uniref:DNA repair protein RAD59 n=1 Tax=Babjeviella inositovora NRRL Y-12698 TaxID=984486 RepID=A0A1E3QNL1_9ASCO|nr:uncharacterized protein BABINDRAFT_162103 [Babjeviella inositovora NRRL Y-12698]ODQ79034.1 hypothetical protein BABINDRAFT_162103 [Babjeviella inositovora NRRL Y-12698]
MTDQAVVWHGDDVASDDEIASSSFKLFPESTSMDFGDVSLWPNRPASKWAGSKLGALQFKLEKLMQRARCNKYSRDNDPKDFPKRIKGFQVIRLANSVFGVHGWSSKITSLKTLVCDMDGSVVNLVVEVTLAVTLKDGTFNEGIGTGSMTNYPAEKIDTKGAVFQMCRKEAVTNALKTCILSFGEDLMERDSARDLKFFDNQIR